MVLEKKIYFSKDIAQFLQISVETLRRRRDQKENELSYFCKFRKVGKRYQVLEVYIDTYEKHLHNKTLVLNDIMSIPNKITTYKEMTQRVGNSFLMSKDDCLEKSIQGAASRTAREMFGTPKTRKKPQKPGTLGSVKRIFAKYNKDIGGYEYLNDEENKYLNERIDLFTKRHCQLTSEDVIEMLCDKESFSQEEIDERTNQWFTARRQDFTPLVIVPTEEEFGIQICRVSEFDVLDEKEVKRLLELKKEQ